MLDKYFDSKLNGIDCVECEDQSGNDRNDSDGITRRTSLKIGGLWLGLGLSGGSQLTGQSSSVAAEIRSGFGGLPVIDKNIIPYFQRGTDHNPINQLTPGNRIRNRLNDVETYTMVAPPEQAAVDVIRGDSSATAAAALITDDEVIDSRYLGAGTTRLTGSADTGQNLNVQVFNLDSDPVAYELEASELEQTPYNDDAWDIPGRIQAEDYDTGGSGVAYEDTTEQNMGGYRDGQVDIESTEDDGSGYNIGWTDAGEWTEYTVNTASGTYDINLRIASYHGDGQIRILLDGELLGLIEVPETGGWQNWESITINDVSVSEAEGSVLRIEAAEGGYNLNWVEFVSSTSNSSTPEQAPFRDQQWTIPGTIQAEDYDTGGPGVAYEDTTEQNMGGYRDGEVDIEGTSDEGGGYNIGWVDTGEWTEYTVETVAGKYEARFRIASYHGDGQIELILDGETLGHIDIPKTGDWQSWETVTISELDLGAGQERVLRVKAVEGGYNLNWIKFVDTSADSGDSTTSPDGGTYGTLGYGEGGYGGVT